ncbi:unnamed protein product [Caenorhabditis angaria]|uniref:C-type lectin domain-containing protein n=1 Tax=Caenorhabditis angaria TaxID=860376 RepID=A0A9P1ISK8_9PELO|nr:unnamed protein product [Caenorhabditis angaria]
MPTEYVDDPEIDEEDDGSTTTPSVTVSTNQSSITSSSTTTKASLTLKRVCPDSSWTLFDRGTYGWCVLVLATKLTMLDYSAECQKYSSNAVVSGLQNQNELTTISELAKKIDPSIVEISVGLRVDVFCSSVPWQPELPIYCELDRLLWTDDHTTGTDGLIWAAGQPLIPQIESPQRAVLLVQEDELEVFDITGTPDGTVCGVEAKEEYV